MRAKKRAPMRGHASDVDMREVRAHFIYVLLDVAYDVSLAMLPFSRCAMARSDATRMT